MEESQQTTQEFVVCVDNSGCPASLELHKIYRTHPDTADLEEGDIRIIDESGEDYIYSRNRFAPIRVPAAVRESFANVR